jgi:acyl-CoA thioester hydrolase
MSSSGHRTFKYSVRVPYAHTDQMGFVYYAHYLVYFEMARAEFLREVGLPYTDMEKRGIMLPVVVAHCEYKKPAHFDDLLEIRSCCTDIRGTRLHIEYEIWRADELLVTGYTEHVCVSAEGKVLRPVPELKRLISDS